MNVASTMFVEDGITWVDGRCTATRSTPKDLATVLAVGHKWFASTREGVILLAPEVHAGIGFPAREPARHRGLDAPLAAARVAGWQVSKTSAWMTFYGDDRPTIHIGLFGWMSTSNHALYDADDPAGMTYRMRRYHELTGVAFRATPGVTGTAMLRDHRRGKAPRWLLDAEGIDAATSTTETAYNWRTRHTYRTPHRHTYDANLSYLGAANVAEVGMDQLVHTGAREFNPKTAGYWLIDVPAWNEDRLPHPCNKPAGTRAWVTTPTMTLLAELDARGMVAMPAVLDSYTCSRTGRMFRDWAARLGNALRDVEQTEAYETDSVPITKTLKRAYSETIGLFYRAGGRIYRPDWYHTIIAQARVNLFRRLLVAAMTEDRWPEEIKTDAVTYGAMKADAEQAIPGNFQLRKGSGGWKHLSTAKRETAA